jgi:predicted transcriptional regulator
VSRARLNIFLEPEHARRLEELATLKGVSKSGIVAAAIASYVSPDGAHQHGATLARRLDAISRQFDRLERDQTVLLETLALWVRHQLAVSSPVPEGLQDAARAQGRARFADFVAQLARHLQRGGSLVGEVWQEIAPDESQRLDPRHVPHSDAERAGHREQPPDGALA